MQVQLAAIGDLPDIKTAYLDSWRAGYKGLLSEDELQLQAERRAESDWWSAVANPDLAVLVAQRAETVIGLAVMEHHPQAARLPMLQMLYVIPTEWGSGAASALLNRALEREGWALDSSMDPTTNGLYPIL
jgi:GNAT superfamily N-acetyltransferase